MKHFLFAALVFLSFAATSQPESLRGTWISADNEMVVIQDTDTTSTNNYLTNENLISKGFRLEIYGDTLSFQSHYSSSAYDYEQTQVVRYDLLVQGHTDSTLMVKPVSSLAKQFFDRRKPIRFTRREYIRDHDFALEKLVFRASRCFGTCPEMALAVTADRQLTMNATYFTGKSDVDKERSGSFTGQLDSATYDSLVQVLVQSRITTLKMPEAELCCDGAVKTIIVHHNGQRTAVKVMFAPAILHDLIDWLYRLPEQVPRTQVAHAFAIEEEP